MERCDIPGFHREGNKQYRKTTSRLVKYSNPQILISPQQRNISFEKQGPSVNQ